MIKKYFTTPDFQDSVILKFSDGKEVYGGKQFITYFIKCDLGYIASILFDHGGELFEEIKRRGGFKTQKDVVDYLKTNSFPADILGCIVRLVPEMPAGYLPGMPKEIQPIMITAEDGKFDEFLKEYRHGVTVDDRRWGVLPDPFIYIGPDDNSIESEVLKDENYEVRWEEIDRAQFESEVM